MAGSKFDVLYGLHPAMTHILGEVDSIKHMRAVQDAVFPPSIRALMLGPSAVFSPRQDSATKALLGHTTISEAQNPASAAFKVVAAGIPGADLIARVMATPPELAIPPSFENFAELEPPSLGDFLCSVQAKPQRARTITIVPRVRCFLCDGDLVADTIERRDGDRVELEFRVVPVCPGCVAEHGNDPSYFEKIVRRLERRNLRLVSRDGETDGVPRARGKLMLIRPKDDDN